jgi:hypothetical protein
MREEERGRESETRQAGRQTERDRQACRQTEHNRNCDASLRLISIATLSHLQALNPGLEVLIHVCVLLASGPGFRVQIQGSGFRVQVEPSPTCNGVLRHMQDNVHQNCLAC